MSPGQAPVGPMRLATPPPKIACGKRAMTGRNRSWEHHLIRQGIEG